MASKERVHRALKGLAVVAMCGIGVSTMAFQSAAKTTLNVWMWNSDLSSVIADYHKLHPDVEVKLSVTTYDLFHDKLLTATVAGTAVPDVTGVEIGYVSRFVSESARMLTCLDSYGAQKYRGSFVDFRWRLASSKGKLYAMPIDVAPVATWYRPGALAESGLPSDPTSVAGMLKVWEDLMTVSKKLVRDTNGDGKPETYSLATGMRVAELIRQQTAARIMDEDLKVVMDKEDVDKWASAWKTGKAFRDFGYESPFQAAFQGTWDSGYRKALKTDKMAFLMEAIWNGVWVKPITGAWGVVPLPTGVGVNEGGSFLAIPAAAKHKTEAYRFIQYVCANTASQAKLMEKAYWFPAYTPAYADSYFQEPAAWCSNQKWLQTFAQSAVATKYMPVTRHDKAANTIVTAELTKVWAGKDIRTALRDAASAVRRSCRGAK